VDAKGGQIIFSSQMQDYEPTSCLSMSADYESAY